MIVKNEEGIHEIQDEKGNVLTDIEPEDAFIDEIEEKKSKINTVDNENGEEATVEYMQRLFVACQKIFGDEDCVYTAEELRMFTNKEELEEIRELIQKTPDVLEKWKNLFIEYELKKQQGEEKPPFQDDGEDDEIEGKDWPNTHYKLSFVNFDLSSYISRVELPSFSHNSWTTIHLIEDENNLTVIHKLEEIIRNEYPLDYQFFFRKNGHKKSFMVEDVTNYKAGEKPEISCINVYGTYKIAFQGRVIF